MIGPQNGATVRVLTKVAFPDNSHVDFDYTSWGQIWKVRRYATATNDHLLNYRSYNLPLNQTTAQTDCPRFTERRDWAANWNRNLSGIEQEAITQFAVPVEANWTMPDGSTLSGTETKVTMPDLTFQKTLFGGPSTVDQWQRGLPLASGTYDNDAGNTRQRWTTTNWTQDVLSVAYALNPRVTETRVGDPANNRSRTRVDYATFNLFDGTTIRLPQDTYQYQADGTTVLRRSHTDYNMNASYADRRIIGLPSASYLCDGTQGAAPCNDSSGASLVSKVTHQYDETGSIQGNDAPVQHDNTNYGGSFLSNQSG